MGTPSSARIIQDVNLALKSLEIVYPENGAAVLWHAIEKAQIEDEKWYWWSVFHLFMLANISDTMHTILSSISTHIGQLVMTFIAMLIAIFLFSLNIMQSYRNEIFEVSFFNKFFRDMRMVNNSIVISSMNVFYLYLTME